ncbi:MAG: 3-methyl-2-oxobutanoate hydroxymethyltransferase [Alphaproteobacteria bacterium GM202ARS2]|nr:3-methyl-2-oxobutanoate hydroxymethyltransferase [Alphaproteobacteria bacterium GM202ARS2]
MSVAPTPLHRITVSQIRARKNARSKLVCLTAQSAPMARLLDPYCDILLVGDSVAMTLYGMETTHTVRLSMMIEHAKAVMRASKRACVVVDMPFATCHESPALAFRHASRVIAETGANAVKIEGGQEIAPTIAFLVKHHIPVMGHVGLMPQALSALGGYHTQGADPRSAQKIVQDAQAIAQAGAFACVIEATYQHVADQITQTIAIPTIGIGASPQCDGQILVTDDMLGLCQQFSPKFLKRYANLAETIEAAVQNYADDVRQGRFPAAEHCSTHKDHRAPLPIKKHPIKNND